MFFFSVCVLLLQHCKLELMSDSLISIREGVLVYLAVGVMVCCCIMILYLFGHLSPCALELLQVKML